MRPVIPMFWLLTFAIEKFHREVLYAVQSSGFKVRASRILGFEGSHKLNQILHFVQDKL
jgi:hypothetical protein